MDHVQTILPFNTRKIVCVSFLVSHSPEYKKSCCAKPCPGNLSGTEGRAGFLTALSAVNCPNEMNSSMIKTGPVIKILPIPFA